MVRVTIDNKEYEFEFGTPFKDIAKKFSPYNGQEILLVKADGKLCELHKCLQHHKKLEFVTLKDNIGQQAYERTAVFILLKAIYDLYPDMSLSDVSIDFKISHGLFVNLKAMPATQDICDAIKEQMLDIISERIQIYKMNLSIDEALRTFHDLKMYDKEKLFKYRRSSRANLYEIDEFTEYFYGYMLYDTGYIHTFNLVPYRGGLMLMLPTIEETDKAPQLEVQDNLFDELVSAHKWVSEMKLATVADLNDHIVENGFTNIILMQEANMEKRLGDVAESIANKSSAKIVFIGGPSSSGKTTFSNRLAIQMTSFGLKPHVIETDNYFKERKDIVPDENGKYDFESLDCVDLDLFTHDMNALIAGEEIDMPTYNFLNGKREYNGEKMKLDSDDVLIIEGIHCLDDAMIGRISNGSLFKIYINPVTPINVDDHNYIHTSDTRLLRRMIRDYKTRGASASMTIEMWPSVRKGEELYISPWIQNADVVFDTSLIYEFPVMKPYAEALLYSVKKDDPAYMEANRLLKLLDYILAMPSEDVPSNSILREFIGGSTFNV